MILLVCTIEYRSKFWLDNFAFTAQYNFVCSISQEYQIWMNGSIFQDKGQSFWCFLIYLSKVAQGVNANGF